jgi:hypothetical protein
MSQVSGLEIYQARQLLRLLDHTDELELPVCIEHRDKPDFLLYTRALKIGLETSNLTDEEVMRGGPPSSHAIPRRIHYDDWPAGRL